MMSIAHFGRQMSDDKVDRWISEAERGSVRKKRAARSQHRQTGNWSWRAQNSDHSSAVISRPEATISASSSK
jgi:hypothetical protein